jgi:hypothetical protein
MPISLQGVGKLKLNYNIRFFNLDKRMQAQETLLGCLQCFRRLEMEGGLVPKLLEASLSVFGPNLSSTSP